MTRLSREVRLWLDDHVSDIVNGHAGFPTPRAIVPFVILRVTLQGAIDRRSGYLINIQQIDAVVRTTALPILLADRSDPMLMRRLHTALADAWPPLALARLELALSPFTSLAVEAEEPAMILLSQKFEFSASHRLHVSELSDAENRELFGKCNNPAGHGHNYEVQVTVRRTDGNLHALVDLEKAVKPVIDRWDHRHLNMEVEPFSEVNPTVENIAEVLFGRIGEVVEGLWSVTVWETPKTRCEVRGGSALSRERLDQPTSATGV